MDKLLIVLLILSINISSTANIYLRCLHGKPVNGRCQCFDGYYGDMCQTEFHCNSSGNPTEAISCDACEPNWSGDFCDKIECGDNGRRSAERAQSCDCVGAHSGPFCRQLHTDDVYFYYNSRVQNYIPLGVLIVVPVLLILYVCNKMARQRQIRRVERALQSAYYVHNASPEAIHQLLYTKPKPSSNRCQH